MEYHDDARRMEQASRSVGEAFSRLVQTYQYCTQRTLSKYGLYPGQPALLFALEASALPTQHDLARKLSVSKASVGVSLRRLEKKGFVKRVRDKADTRCIRVALTPRGQEYARWCRIDYDMLYASMLEHLLPQERTDDLLALLTGMERGLDDLKRRLAL